MLRIQRKKNSKKYIVTVPTPNEEFVETYPVVGTIEYSGCDGKWLDIPKVGEHTACDAKELQQLADAVKGAK